MPKKHRVRIRIVSDQEQEQTIQEFRGERIDKDSQVYIRYEENLTDTPLTGEAAKTMTTLKLGIDVIKLIRHGAVQSEQSFQMGKKLPGFYRSPFVQLQLSQMTSRLRIDLQDVAGTVEWEYELFAHEESTGQFKVSLTIQEDPDHESE